MRWPEDSLDSGKFWGLRGQVGGKRVGLIAEGDDSGTVQPARKNVVPELRFM